VLLQRLVLELRAGILPAAALVERLGKAEMRALIAALASAAAEDGSDRSIRAKTEKYPMSTRPADGDSEPSHGDTSANGLITALHDGRLDPATLARRCEAPELRRLIAELLARATVEAPGPGVANGSSLLAGTIERRRSAVADGFSSPLWP
jgi:hypothetical protein